MIDSVLSAAWVLLCVFLGLAALVVSILGGLLVYMKSTKPRLPGPAMFTLGKRFKNQREDMFVDVLQECGSLSADFEGFFVTADPTVVKQLMNSKEHTATRSKLYQLSRWLLPAMDGVLNLHGDDWMRHTRALREIFHASHISKQQPIVAAAAAKHVRAWLQGAAAVRGVLAANPGAQAGGPDLLSAVRGIGMDCILQVGFGIDPSSSVGEALAGDLSLYPELVGNFSAAGAALSSFWQLQACGARIKQHTAAAITATQELKRECPDIPEHDPRVYNFLSQMAAADFPLWETAREVNHIHGAHKAASFAITCALHTLTHNPEWITKLRSEWRRVLGGGSAEPGKQRAPRPEDAEALPLTMCVIAECLRKHVVSLGVVRQTGKPLDVCGKVMPAGTEVVVLLHALHHHPDIWEEPQAFKPERFLSNGKCETARFERQHKYIPFLRGSRMCAGHKLAEMEILVVLHAVLSQVDITISGEDKLKLKDDMYSALDETLSFTVMPLQQL